MGAAATRLGRMLDGSVMVIPLKGDEIVETSRWRHMPRPAEIRGWDCEYFGHLRLEGSDECVVCLAPRLS